VNRISIVSLTLLLLLLAGARPGRAQAASDSELRRFALIIGANDGGSDRVRLRYATTDADAVARVVRELGGVAPADLEILLDPASQALDAGFAAMQRKLAAARQARVRIELLVYYSGHSDEEGLLLGGARYSYARLRDQIRAMPADVHIAILDSCASGAFTRTKGGTRQPSFLVDSANQVRGHAFLSSSSADEAAQESDRIGASFFTHYLISGLRGGADRNRDGRVTLNEAYQFAFEETVSRTATTQHGTQHPAYDMHLAGTGDVVMTDLRATHAALVLAAEIDGRVLIRNAQGRLVVELQKSRGAPMTLGLGPERYHVTLQRGTRHFQAMVDLGRGGEAMLTEAALKAAAPELAVARGATRADTVSGEPPLVWASVSLIPPMSTSAVEVRHYVALNLLVGAGVALDGVELGGVANVRTRHARGLQLGGVLNWAGGDVTGIQSGGVANWAGGDLLGLQLGGVASVARGSTRGIQVGGVTSVAGRDVRGAQISGVTNWAGGDVTGLQVGGVANVASDLRGAQVGGVINVGGGLQGMQLAVLNIGGEVTGLQLGVVNVARHVRGLQLGVVNVAENVDGASVGLVSAVRNGHRAAEAWATDIVPMLVGVKFGSRHVYTLFAAGATPDVAHVGAGLGVHAPLGRLYLDVDVTSYELLRFDGATNPTDMLAQGRVMVGIPILPHVSVFGGAAVNAAFAFDGQGEDLSRLGARVFRGDDVVLRLSPGLFAGVSLH
jgi:Caspase domain